MPLATFVSELTTTGRVRVPATLDLGGAQLAPVGAALQDADRRARADLALDPPPLSASAGTWAVLVLFRACQLFVHRDWDHALHEAAAGAVAPDPDDPAAIYSTDLIFRYIPDLWTLARLVSERDPLVGALAGLGRTWPLSSVGVSDLGPVEVGAILAHPTLARLYTDRIIARRDRSRLVDPRVRAAVEASVGLHRDLAPGLVAPATEGP